MQGAKHGRAPAAKAPSQQVRQRPQPDLGGYLPEFRNHLSSIPKKQLNKLWDEQRDKLSPEEQEILREVVREALEIEVTVVPATGRDFCGKCCRLRNECTCTRR